MAQGFYETMHDLTLDDHALPAMSATHNQVSFLQEVGQELKEADFEHKEVLEIMMAHFLEAAFSLGVMHKGIVVWLDDLFDQSFHVKNKGVQLGADKITVEEGFGLLKRIFEEVAKETGYDPVEEISYQRFRLRKIKQKFLL